MCFEFLFDFLLFRFRLLLRLLLLRFLLVFRRLLLLLQQKLDSAGAQGVFSYR